MSRAWPFESETDTPDEQEPLEHVARIGPKGAEAVVVRIGQADAQLVVVGADGAWKRWVYRSMEDAKRLAEGLGIPVHTGEYPESTRVRMNAYRRAAESFATSAYPEQGAVGPVRPYPENRPRVLGDRRRESPAGPAP